MNTGSQHHLAFFGVASFRTELRIRNDEVVGSIPTSSTNRLPWYLPLRIAPQGFGAVRSALCFFLFPQTLITLRQQLPKFRIIVLRGR